MPIGVHTTSFTSPVANRWSFPDYILQPTFVTVLTSLAISRMTTLPFIRPSPLPDTPPLLLRIHVRNTVICCTITDSMPTGSGPPRAILSPLWVALLYTLWSWKALICPLKEIVWLFMVYNFILMITCCSSSQSIVCIHFSESTWNKTVNQYLHGHNVMNKIGSLGVPFH